MAQLNGRGTVSFWGRVTSSMSVTVTLIAFANPGFGVEMASTNAVKSIGPNPGYEEQAQENLDRGRAEDQKVAQHQKAKASDMRITRMIRQALIRDQSLSTSAHNVTVITRKGEVTLKGNVASRAEQATVLGTARSIAGDSSVVDQLSVMSE